MSPIEIKAIVRYRDGFRCVECGMTNDQHIEQFGRSLEVHRIVPGTPYTIEGAETLCRPCHKTKPKSPHGTRGIWSFRIHDEVYEQFKILAKQNHRPVKYEIELALMAHLQENGLWPKVKIESA